MATKKCNGECGEILPISDFTKNRSKADGLDYRCRECKNAAQRQQHAADPEKYRAANKKRYAANPKKNRAASKRWHAANPDANWEQDLLRKYNMTREQHDQRLKDQNWVCAICGKPETVKSRNGKTRRLCVDHIGDCHKGGKVRGLLCSKHNRAIGQFDQTPGLLEAYVAYLQRNNRCLKP